MVLFLIVAAGCVHSGDQPCGDSLVCSAGTTCIALTRPGEVGFACANDDQLAACDGVEDGMGCTIDGVTGSCVGGACLPSVCGDGINDPVYEKCDDGNVRSGDGCSGDCQSLETCGNLTTDLAVGEQCDEGSLSITGDSCSFHCQREYRLWRDVNPLPPALRHGFGLTTDLSRGIVMVGGGTLGNTPSSNGSAQFSDTWRWDDSTWLELRTPQPPPVRTNAALANDNQGHILMFGGYDESGVAVDDTLLWDGVTWRKIATSPRPSARAAASLACATGAATLCILFGGQNGTTYFDDVWKWNGTAWTALTLTPRPGARRNAGLTFDNLLKRFVMYGGEDGPAKYFDLWTFESDAWTSRVQLPSPNQPRANAAPTTAWSPMDQRVILLASDSTGSMRTWSLNGTLFVWTDHGPAPPGDAPKLVSSSSPPRVLSISPQATTDSMLMYSFSGGSWSQTRDTRPTKSNKKTPAAFDELRGITVVLDSGTFEWNGVGWRLTASAGQSHPTSDGAALAYHGQCGAVIAFGGGDVDPAANNRNNTTSRYPQTSGLTWAPLAAPGPTPRTRHAMTYDLARKAIVMFGGLVPAPMNIGNDTWELKTTDCQTWTWTEIQPSTRPSPRSSATLVYDEKRNVSVLFGGLDANGMRLADTWEWDGAAWKQRMTPAAGTPDGRFEHMAAYDPRRQRVVLFGGRGSSSKLSDTWELDGEAGAWVRLAPAITPAPRNGSGFALDVTGNLLAVNGDLGTTSSIALIRLSSELSTEPPETCVRATDDLDGDGLTACKDPDCWGRCAPICPPGRTCAADAPRCGNSTCDPLEDYVLCPGDCPP